MPWTLRFNEFELNGVVPRPLRSDEVKLHGVMPWTLRFNEFELNGVVPRTLKSDESELHGVSPRTLRFDTVSTMLLFNLCGWSSEVLCLACN